MNILIPDSWLREFLETNATPLEIKNFLSLCGPSVERITKNDNDSIYEIEITTNRIDTVSVLGIAREAATILPRFGKRAKLLKPDIKLKQSPKKISLPLTVKDPDKLTRRVLAVVLDDVKIDKSPEYITKRLEMSGIRSLNNVIDITNYVMLEMGHPTHVFDYDRIKSHLLLIRRANKGESLITLDGKKCFLDHEDVVIDDGNGEIIDLPGIMGTENSVVTKNTKRIIFFIESNNPTVIRKTSMRLSLRTMAANINEKNPDIELAKQAFIRGINLFERVVGAKIAGSIIDIYHNPKKPQPIQITTDFVNSRLGIQLLTKDIVEILKSLNFRGDLIEKDNIKIIPPTYRSTDIIIKEDIIEEIARIYGYHNLPGNLMNGFIPQIKPSYNQNTEFTAKNILKYWGYTETYSYSFISEETAQKAQIPTSDLLKIANPLTADFVYMRNSLIPSMLEVISKNQNLRDSLKLFELSKIYLKNDKYLPHELPILIISNQESFFSLKGVLLSLLAELGLKDLDENVSAYKFFHPKQSINFIKNKKTIAQLGTLLPHLKSNFRLKKNTYIALVNMELLESEKDTSKKYVSIPKFPPVFEDLSLKIPPYTKLGIVIKNLYKINPLIYDIKLIDKFRDSITVKITYLDQKKNLTGEEVREIREIILKKLASDFSIKLKS